MFPDRQFPVADRDARQQRADLQIRQAEENRHWFLLQELRAECQLRPRLSPLAPEGTHQVARLAVQLLLQGDRGRSDKGFYLDNRRSDGSYRLYPDMSMLRIGIGYDP